MFVSCEHYFEEKVKGMLELMSVTGLIYSKYSENASLKKSVLIEPRTIRGRGMGRSSVHGRGVIICKGPVVAEMF